MISRRELLSLLALPPESAEAATMRSRADAVSRHRFAGRGLLLGQIGVESHACPGNCRFCSFAESLFGGQALKLNVEAAATAALDFAATGIPGALFLMTMHDFPVEGLLELVRRVRAGLPTGMQLVLNIGDCEPTVWQEFKSAGATGAYHVLRLREGVDTALAPSARLATIRAIREAGLDWYYCCEPIGPEHSDEELADAILLGNEFGCYQHAAMARVSFAGGPLVGEISRERLAQIVAVLTLASQDNPNLRSIAVHEPDALSLRSGANSVYAECGANPRDLAADTAEGRGRGLNDLRHMLTEAAWYVG